MSHLGVSLLRPSVIPPTLLPWNYVSHILEEDIDGWMIKSKTKAMMEWLNKWLDRENDSKVRGFDEWECKELVHFSMVQDHRQWEWCEASQLCRHVNTSLYFGDEHNGVVTEILVLLDISVL